MKKLRQEREVTGLYISGHPLDDFKLEMKHFTNSRMANLHHLDSLVNRELLLGGIVADVKHLETRQGKGFAKFFVEDYDDSYEFAIFGEEDRKSTRLNSSHVRISYAVFCLKKKTSGRSASTA